MRNWGRGMTSFAMLADPPWQERRLLECEGHLMFARGDYPLRLSQVAFVKVGAVSGLTKSMLTPSTESRLRLFGHGAKWADASHAVVRTGRTAGTGGLAAAQGPAARASHPALRRGGLVAVGAGLLPVAVAAGV